MTSDEAADEKAGESEGGVQATEEAARSGTREAGETDKGGPHAEADGHGAPDKSPRRTEEHEPLQRAEVSNYEIVSHWFGVAAERLDLRDDIAAVLRSSGSTSRPRTAGSWCRASATSARGRCA